MRNWIIIFLLTGLVVNLAAETTIQDDTVKVMSLTEFPVFDGLGSDNCWSGCNWQSIDQVWIEYGQPLDSADFHGRFKIAWSPAENVLCFLVEIVDDVFVDGYAYARDPATGGGYSNYDIVEVFIDQNKSGGLHVFDGTGNTARDWGTNAENAFAYHISANRPPVGEVTHQKIVCDIAGKDWGNYYIPNFAGHLPEFALRQADGKFIWEFSLQVYNDNYDAANPAASWVLLKPGDLMGLSVAYCDNDQPDEVPKQRDNFIGSVWVPAAAFNDHWMNANGFGTIQLLGDPAGIRQNPGKFPMEMEIYPNPGKGILNLRLQPYFGENTVIKVFNLLGQTVFEDAPASVGEFQLKLGHLPNGTYFLTAGQNQQVLVEKFSILKE